MNCRPFVLTLFCVLPVSALAQITLPVGTQLPVSLPNHLPLRVGVPLHAELMYPVYANNQMVLPAKTVVNGTVISLTADHKRRRLARLGADFTPLRTPVVRFDSVVLGDGTVVPITTGPATDGAPVFRLVAPPPTKGGMVSREFAMVKQMVKDRVKVVTGPDKGDRAVQFIYSQLPYHPQRIQKDTSWTLETAAPVTLPDSAVAAHAAAPVPRGGEPPRTWLLEAYLEQGISSETSKPGQTIRATVAEPIFNPDGTVAVPEGSVLTGTVSQARPARRLSRPGELRFSFRQLTLPGGEPQSVRASLQGTDSKSDQELAMDSEGNVKPKPQDKVVVPLILLALAAAPLDSDGGRHHHLLGKNAVASNSLGLIGLIVGTAAQQPNVAAGIGYYGAAVSIYQRIFARGKEVSFARDTRMTVQTAATRGAAIKAGQ